VRGGWCSAPRYLSLSSVHDVVWRSRTFELRSVHQNQFGLLQRGDLQLHLVADRDAVAGVDRHAVDFDRTRRRHQIEAALLVGRILRALAGLQRGGEHPRVGADRQRIVVASWRFAPETQPLTEGERCLARGHV
jgi:hypothetical protein